MSLIVVDDDSSDELEMVSDGGQGMEGCSEPKPGPSRKPSAQKASLSMDERPYDDAETVDTADNSSDDEDKPLLDLMKHLINYNGKQNTKLTNSQLIGILKKEFDLDVANLHSISVDIYMNVLKKFLKDWPQWDEFDQVMHETRCMNDNEEVEKMLNREYSALKDYLAAILKATQPLAKEAAEKLTRSLEIPASSRTEPGDVVLEINCTRDQLNTLIFRKPHPDYKSTIFNIEDSIPSKISINTQTFQSMINSGYVNISINMACFQYKRDILPNFKRTLVNKKLRHLKREPPLNKHLQLFKNLKTASEINKMDLKSVIEKIKRSNRYGFEQQYALETILKTILDDFNVLLNSHSFQDRMQLPCVFRFYMSNYPYVRHLYKEVDTHSDKYDLQLEEKIAPMMRFNISRLNLVPHAEKKDSNWLGLECTICQLRYCGIQGIEALKTHFREAHQNEPNWTCTNCDKEFEACHLASARWHHKCESVITCKVALSKSRPSRKFAPPSLRVRPLRPNK